MDKSKYTLFHDKCGEIEQRFGRQGKLPLKLLDLNRARCVRLLDFGAGKGMNAGLCDEYYTLDADETLNPSFKSLQEVRASKLTFGGIIANQVFEHIELDAIDGVVKRLCRVMDPWSTLVATIPNVHRGSYFFNDIDHKTPLMYYHLAAFFETNGLRVIDAYRYTKNHNAIVGASEEMKVLMDLLENLYELDPAQFIAVVARRENVG